MNFGSLLKWGIGFGAAYWLYESGLLSSLTGGALPAPAPSGTATPPANPSGAPPTNPASSSVPTKALVAAKAQQYGQGPLLDFYGWNVYYKIVRGQDGPPIPAGLDPNKNLSIDEYWSYISAAGLNGYVGAGMGGFVSREMQYTFENPFTPPPEGLVAIPRV